MDNQKAESDTGRSPREASQEQSMGRVTNELLEMERTDVGRAEPLSEQIIGMFNGSMQVLHS